ncbi:MAG TPA: ATP-dependent DNA helicase RecG [Candidatus Dormibacteraeota bacterium]|nr:ATP-dependent DNA helicase RecG [Candidatus Dormibacteraeota bacterium]
MRTVRDLLFHLPRRYDDLRELRRLGELGSVADGQVVSARVRVVDIRVEQTWRRRVQRTIAQLADETGTAEAAWFGRRFIERRLHAGDRVVISGRLRRRGWMVSFDDPEFQLDDGSALLHAGRIVPVYRLTAGLTAPRLRTAVRAALDRAGAEYPEYLPEDLRAGLGLPGIGGALEEAHFPVTFEGRDAALDRLAFDELLALQLGMVERRRQRGASPTVAVAVDEPTHRRVRAAIVASLRRRLGEDVELTADQATAMDSIRDDLGRAVPMLRLLQGDVGSGKTAVAAYALALVALTGRQGALLAPTDLLARQHLVTVSALLEDLALPVTLLTGSLSADARRNSLDAIASGQAAVVVGTHALIGEAVEFADLGLVVVDEQHRFGVEQRNELEAKSRLPPHVLLMTATPIPRTVGQVVYADLDVTDLHTQPKGRLPIRTAIRRPDGLERLWAFVKEEAAEGHRTFVVVPLISDEGDGGGEAGDGDPHDDELDDPARVEAAAIAAEAEHLRLSRELAPLRVGRVHGRLRPADRDREMARFRDGDLDVLVGTTVIEVGVDVPEATVMVVEGADRFGLAQLHQLRGRVGRGTAESYCVLVSDVADDTVGWARLRAIERLDDGFLLAEEDFALRGEGDVLGLAQSGLPRLRVASLQRADHRELAVRARGAAEDLLDPAGNLVAGHERLAAELATGWLAPVRSGDPGGGA